MEMQGEMMKVSLKKQKYYENIECCKLVFLLQLGMVNEMIDDTLSNMNDDVEIDNQKVIYKIKNLSNNFKLPFL